MNRILNTLTGLVLAGGVLSLPFATSAFAQSRTGTHQRGSLVNYVATIEGVTPAVLKQDLQAGQTLLQIAGGKYASADDLATALLTRVKTKLDHAVSTNQLSATQETTLYTKLHNRVAQLVVTPHPKLSMLWRGMHAGTHTGATTSGTQAAAGRPAGGIRSALVQTVVTTCSTTQSALKSAIQTGGKSLLAICQATNPSVTQATLVDAIMAAIKTKLDAAVSANKINATQESMMLSRLQALVNRLVTTPIPAGGLHLG